MRRLAAGLLLAFAATPAAAQSKEPIALRDMGSFHVGGRIIEITGQPVKEVVFTPGGVPAKVDPNGKYQIEQMYVQYFLPQNKKGKLPLLLWHGGGLSGVTYETEPDGGDGWMQYSSARAGTLMYPMRWSVAAPAGAAPSGAMRWRCRSAIRGSASAWAPLARGTTIRRSARPIRACSFPPRPTGSS